MAENDDHMPNMETQNTLLIKRMVMVISVQCTEWRHVTWLVIQDLFQTLVNTITVRVVKGIIPDQIFYPHPHFLPIFCLNLRKKVMENPRKSHPFYNPEWGIDWLISPRF